MAATLTGQRRIRTSSRSRRRWSNSNKGQVTEIPVQTQFGWHVIRLDDVRDTQFPPLEQVTPQIREGLQQQRVQAFVETLRKSAKIQ